MKTQQRRRNKTVWKKFELQHNFPIRSYASQQRTFSEEPKITYPNRGQMLNSENSRIWDENRGRSEHWNVRTSERPHNIGLDEAWERKDWTPHDQGDIGKLDVRTEQELQMLNPENGAMRTACAAYLSNEQVKRLRSILVERVEILGCGNFPRILTRLIDLIVCVFAKLKACRVIPRHVKLNGGAASYVVAAGDFSYADFDFIVPIVFEDERKAAFNLVRKAVFTALVELLPKEISKTTIMIDELKHVYLRKMVKVDDSDSWSLFSFNNNAGRPIEFKFVDKMKRQFQFSVDSFQITIDPLLENLQETRILIKSVFGDIRMALRHLNKRLIDTTHPEEIRGGGLLKYCHLIICGYKTIKGQELERYMCSRFFIDFPAISLQESKLKNYLHDHFRNYVTCTSSQTSNASVQQLEFNFLTLLHRVIFESAVCLVNQERRQTLSMIDRLMYEIAMGG